MEDIKKATGATAAGKTQELNNVKGKQFIDSISKEVATTFDESMLSKVYIPCWSNRPKPLPAVLSLNNKSILTHQNTSAIIAAPGIGKSSICEAVLSAFINPHVDNLGWSVGGGCEGVLYVDNERVDEDVWKSFNRMCTRAQVPYNTEPANVKIAGMRSVPRLNERMQKIEILLTEGNYSLLLLDGAGDLVTDTNDLPNAVECRIWLRELTIKYNLSILTTLHPNPNSNKPRGHIGSEICREAECVLLAKKGEGETRILTTDFEQGKNRNGEQIKTGFQWSDEHFMFVSADVSEENKTLVKEAKTRLAAEAIAQTIPAQSALTHSDLVEHIIEHKGCSEATAKRRIGDMLQFNNIKKHEDGLYRRDL